MEPGAVRTFADALVRRLDAAADPLGPPPAWPADLAAASLEQARRQCVLEHAVLLGELRRLAAAVQRDSLAGESLRESGLVTRLVARQSTGCAATVLPPVEWDDAISMCALQLVARSDVDDDQAPALMLGLRDWASRLACEHVDAAANRAATGAENPSQIVLERLMAALDTLCQKAHLSRHLASDRAFLTTMARLLVSEVRFLEHYEAADTLGQPASAARAPPFGDALPVESCHLANTCLLLVASLGQAVVMRASDGADAQLVFQACMAAMDRACASPQQWYNFATVYTMHVARLLAHFLDDGVGDNACLCARRVLELALAMAGDTRRPDGVRQELVAVARQVLEADTGAAAVRAAAKHGRAALLDAARVALGSCARRADWTVAMTDAFGLARMLLPPPAEAASGPSSSTPTPACAEAARRTAAALPGTTEMAALASFLSGRDTASTDRENVRHVCWMLILGLDTSDESVAQAAEVIARLDAFSGTLAASLAKDGSALAETAGDAAAPTLAERAQWVMLQCQATSLTT